MKLIFILLFVELFSDPCNHVVRSETSANNGYAIIENDSVYGNIKINLEHDRIMVIMNNTNRLITARQLKRVVMNDVSYVSGKLGENYYLFEEIVRHESSLIYREGLKEYALDEETIGPWFILRKGIITRVQKSSHLMVFFESDAKWMKQHMKANDLDPRVKEDMIRALQHYESSTL